MYLHEWSTLVDVVARCCGAEVQASASGAARVIEAFTT